ncbi:hypothetical protein LZK82_25080 (plasmid) [Rhizobium leguminosarum]|nr:hypothetical protein [Rhizobium leguminosarum]UIK01318.1 hypothetical protein LZK82_25080 [Rhizobium leguminosarum]UIK14231.1 hypothetical protein LZK80_30720 [Rhizobium leguminosarum]UIL30355.1 hypothetical protein LZK75_25405 [Rhizobium leguminosarum]WFT90652.1 hypothetical protein QA638_37165 [Rhizobium leguminosarum]
MTGGNGVLDRFGNVAELLVTIDMSGSLKRLGIGLKRIAEPPPEKARSQEDCIALDQESGCFQTVVSSPERRFVFTGRRPFEH